MDILIEELVSKPEIYLTGDQALKEKCFNVSKASFDKGNSLRCYGTLKKLLGPEDGFPGADQIYELLQLRNSAVLSHSRRLLEDRSLFGELLNQQHQAIVSHESGISEAGSYEGSDSEGSDIYSEDSESEALQNRNDLLSESDSELVNQPGQELASDVESDSTANYSEASYKDELNQDFEDLPESSDNEQDNFADLNDSDSHGELETSEKNQPRKSIVDDDFFSLEQMHNFAEEAEQTEMRDRQILAGEGDPFLSKNEPKSDEESESDEDDDIDYFQDELSMGSDASGADGGNLMYADFFEPPKFSKRSAAKESREAHAKRVKFDMESYNKPKKSDEKSFSENTENTEDIESGMEQDDSGDNIEPSEGSTTIRATDMLNSDNEEGLDTENMSRYELYQKQMNSQIEKLEKESIEKKSYLMSGETNSHLRPVDSLLADHIDYDYVQKPVPIITQEVTESLEDLIKRRILDNSFDDVVRKKLDLEDTYYKSSRVELDDSAPKQSLAEVYEKEYMDSKEGLGAKAQKSKYTDAELALHKEIDVLILELNKKLNSLTNFYYQPKISVPNAEIRVDAPAIQMEETLPIHISNASQLAPEEVYANVDGKRGKTNTSLLASVQEPELESDNDSGESRIKIEDPVMYGASTGNVKGPSEITKADRRKMRAQKKKAFKQSSKDRIIAKNEKLASKEAKPSNSSENPVKTNV